MATDKLFSVVGVACKNGTYKVRWANDLPSRVKMLTRDKQEDIRLVELSEPVTKLEAVQAIIDHEWFQDDNAQQAIDDYLYSAGVQAKPIKVNKIVEQKEVDIDEATTYDLEKTYDDLFDEEDVYAESMS